MSDVERGLAGAAPSRLIPVAPKVPGNRLSQSVKEIGNGLALRTAYSSSTTLLGFVFWLFVRGPSGLSSRFGQLRLIHALHESKCMSRRWSCNTDLEQ